MRMLTWASRVLAVIVSLALVVTLGSLPASAASPTIDSFIKVTSVTPTGKDQIVVKLTIKRTLPKQVGLDVSWRLAKAARSNAAYSRKAVYGSKGAKKTYTLTKVNGRITPVRVVFNLAATRSGEQKNYYRRTGPTSHTAAYTVSAKRAVANSLAMAAPGAVLTFAPQGRVIKIAGATLLGWTIFSDVKASVSGKSNSCPKLKKGQYVVQTTRYGLSGSKIKVTANTKMWSSKSAYSAKRKTLCNVSYTLATFS